MTSAELAQARATDGRAYWRGLSDSVMWAELGPKQLVNVGLRKPGSDRGVIRGRVTIDIVERQRGETAVLSLPGVTLIDRDGTLPVLRVRVRDLATLVLLRRLPHIDYVEPDRLKPPPGGLLQNTCTNDAWNDEMFSWYPGDTVGAKIGTQNVHLAWGMTDGGLGITIGLLDSGIDSITPALHEEFDDGMSAGRTIRTAHTIGTHDWDECGHGTHMAGTLVAPRDGKGVAGIAWHANFFSVKTVSSPIYFPMEEGEITALRNAIDSVAPVARIIVFGFGSVYGSIPSVEDKIDEWYYGSDRMFVAPAGNSNPYLNQVVFPARYPIVVAATGTSDACENCVDGPEIDFEAKTSNPSVPALSLGPAPLQGNTQSSNASAIVAGIAALVWGKFPHWSQEQVIYRMASCSVYGQFGYKHDRKGWGYTDILCAVQAEVLWIADVTGPSEIRPACSYSWTAETNVPNPIFEWKIGETVIGTDQSVSYSHPEEGEFQLHVAVTSASGSANASGQKLIMVDYAYGTCG